MSDVDQVRAWVTRRLGAVPDMDLAEASAQLAEIELVLGDMKTLAGDLGRRIVALKPAEVREGVLVESGGRAALVKVTAPKPKQEWDDEQLLAAVIARALDARRLDAETGEYEREGDAMARVLSTVWPLVGRTARIGALKELGLDPGAFREFVKSTSDPKIDVTLVSS